MSDDKRDVFGRSFRLKSDLRQRDVAAWNAAYAAYAGRNAWAVERQAALEAAIAAGWIEEPATAAEEVVDMKTGGHSRRFTFDGVLVDDMTPAEVNYYGGQCSRLFDSLMAIPKATSSA